MKKKKENKMDKILTDIIKKNTNFEDYFEQNNCVPIFSNPRYTTPMFPNIPCPITSRFNIPEENANKMTTS